MPRGSGSGKALLMVSDHHFDKGSEWLNGGLHPSERMDIVIVNWNSKLLLRECIAALDQSSIASSLRVFVVDNASRDFSACALAATRIDIKLLHNRRNLGFAVGCNMGAACGTAENIVFLNPDVRVERDTMEQILRFLNDRDNSAIGVVGIQLVDDKGNIHRSCARKPTSVALLLRTMFLERVVPRIVRPHFLAEWDHRDTRTVDQVMGACLTIRRILFKRLGGFDERFFLYYEDLDLCISAASQGWKVVYFPGAVAEHDGGGTTTAIPVRRIFYLANSRIKYALKWHGPLVAAILLVLTYAAEIPARFALLWWKLVFSWWKKALCANIISWV
ncbi:MAG: glycosyltransferase family 2 protein [Candidatus Binatia bacterium]